MSINITINLSGVKQLKERNEVFMGTKLLEAGLKRGALYLKTQSAIYPPKPPQSTYNRKGAAGGLASGWQIDGEIKDLPSSCAITSPTRNGCKARSKRGFISVQDGATCRPS